MRRTIITSALIVAAPVALVVAVAYNALTIVTDILGDVIALYERAGRSV